MLDTLLPLHQHQVIANTQSVPHRVSQMILFVFYHGGCSEQAKITAVKLLQQQIECSMEVLMVVKQSHVIVRMDCCVSALALVFSHPL